VHEGNPLLNNAAQLAIDLCLIVFVAAGTNNAGTLLDKAPILFGPFDKLHVQCAIFHGFDPWIFW
jgi:hypothetical protein